jgi:hypothetical protein
MGYGSTWLMAGIECHMPLVSRWGRNEWNEEGSILPVPPATAILTMMMFC